MKNLTLPTTIEKTDLLPFDLFKVADNETALTLVPIKNLEASPAMINLLLRKITWRGYTYEDVDGIKKIGYNLTDGVNGNGLTEQESYSKWIEVFKDAERRFKEVFVLDSASLIFLHIFFPKSAYLPKNLSLTFCSINSGTCSSMAVRTNFLIASISAFGRDQFSELKA